LVSSISYKQYYYRLKYHGKFYSGKVAAANDLDAEREVRQDVGFRKYSFCSAIIITDSENKEVMARGNTSELAGVKPKPANFPKYTTSEM
jgi:hypothetical protein